MTTRIGRLELTEDIVNEVELSGEVLSVSGDFCPGTVAGGVVIRDALAALLNNPDEPVIPFTSTDDPSFDGMYEVTGGSVSSRGGTWLNGIWDWSLKLRAVTRGTAIVESRLEFTGITNDDAQAPSHWHATPKVAGYGWGTQTAIDAGTATIATRDSASGDVLFVADPALDDNVATWQADPSLWYQGAVKVTDVDGNVVIGRRNALELGCVLSNDLERVTVDEFGGFLSLTHELYDGTGWVSEDVWMLAFDNGGGLEHFTAPTVVPLVANGPEYAALKVRTFDDEYHPVEVNISLRRGSRMVNYQAATHTAWRLEHGAGVMVGRAGTDLDAGFYGAADGDGNGWVVGITEDDTTAVIPTEETWIVEASPANGTLLFGIGHALDLASPADGDAPQEVVDQWLSGGSELWQVIR